MSGVLDGSTGRLSRIAGPVVEATGLSNVRLYDVVQVGERVYTSELPLVAELGPGLLGRVYDGLQRPLADLVAATGNFVERGVAAPALPQDVRWAFSPCVTAGEQVHPGDILGVIPESQSIEHRIMVPPNISGRVVEVD